MKHIPEAFLHYVWKYRLFDENPMKTEDGTSVQVIDPGQPNEDAGPDFFNARIKINGTLWAGNVEIHIHSSDWFKHQHHTNKAYDNVILQVVLGDDREIRRTNGQKIPTVEIAFDRNLFQNYQSLLNSDHWIACEEHIDQADPFSKLLWMEKLTIERLESKYKEIEHLLEQYNNHWEKAFYQKLARNFGFKTNGDPFERLAKSISLEYIYKCKDNLLQLEALFFGQAGFLDQSLSQDPYFMQLAKEYSYLRKRFKLNPMELYLWKFSKLRPVNFPTLRIAQFAKLIHLSSALFSKTLEISSLRELMELFDIELTGYWRGHYTFQKQSTIKPKRIGRQAVYSIIINTLVPFLFLYGDRKNKPHQKEKALRFLEEIPAENNRIIRKWRELGMIPENAFQSQALIHLKNAYCNQKKCLDCTIGNKIINQRTNECL
jgi:hypothetical protein